MAELNGLSTLNMFHGSPYATEEQLRNRLEGFTDEYVSQIMDLPMMGLEAIAPDAGYTPGELRSSPQDRLRGQRFAWEEYQQARKENPDYASGSQLGHGAAMVADPFFDLPGLAAVKMAPAVKAALHEGMSLDEIIKAGKRALASEVGAIGDVDKIKTARDLKAALLRDIKRAREAGEENIGIRVFHDDQNILRGEVVPTSFNWEDGDIIVDDPLSGTAVFDPEYIDEALAYSLGGGERLGVLTGSGFGEHYMPEVGASSLEDARLFGDLYPRTQDLRGVWDKRGLKDKIQK